MPSGLRKTTGNHFEIYYEQPWGGIATNADTVDIQPNQFTNASGLVNIDGRLCSASVSAQNNLYLFTPHTAGATIANIFTMAGSIFLLDNAGNVYKYNASSGNFAYVITASDGPWAITSFSLNTPVKVISGTAYISVPWRNSIYTFDGNVTYALASNYSGGLVLGVLNDQLLQLNVNSSIDGLQPNRISWSGPGLFTTWNPAVNRTAGFNNLANIDDELTGFLSLASVGVAISAKGLTELSPTGVAIGPFNFTALWNSNVGQGSTYPFTITQHGQIGFLASNEGVFTVSTAGGLQDISQAIKTNLLAAFQQTNTGNTSNAISGEVMLYFYNLSYPSMFYALAVPSVLNAAGSSDFGQLVTVWMYDMSAGAWYSIVFNTAALCNAQNGTNIPTSGLGGILTDIHVVTMQQVATGFPSFANVNVDITLIYFTIFFGGNSFSTVAQLYAANLMNLPSVAAPQAPLSITFRAEEIKLGRQPTIRRVVIRATGTGTLAFAVSGVSFGSVIVNTPIGVFKTFESTQNMYTGEDPQLTITSNAFSGAITKAMLGGTYADGDID